MKAPALAHVLTPAQKRNQPIDYEQEQEHEHEHE
jgi:hypothetical protein